MVLYPIGGGTSASGVVSLIAGNGISVSAATGNVTVSINGANSVSWTAAQTFTNSDIRLLGSSTGYTTFTSANAGASNFTLTFPAVTGTLALLGGAQVLTANTSFQLPSSGTWSILDHSGVAILTATDGSPDTLKSGVGLQVFAATAGLSTSTVLLSAQSGAASILEWSVNNRIRLNGIGGSFVELNGANLTVSTAGIIPTYNGIGTAGLGVPAIYAVTTTGVLLQTTSTIINNSFTPSTSALVQVVVTVTPLTAFAKTGTVTVTYTDVAAGAPVTQTQLIASTASAVPQSFTFLCHATTATAIAVAGTITTNNDASAACAITQLTAA